MTYPICHGHLIRPILDPVKGTWGAEAMDHKGAISYRVPFAYGNHEGAVAAVCSWLARYEEKRRAWFRVHGSYPPEGMPL